MKPPVEFVRKKLDNAVQIMCSLITPLDRNQNMSKLDKWNSAFVMSSARQRKKAIQYRGGLKGHSGDSF